METETSNKYSVLMLEKGMGVLELLADYHSGLTIQEMCSHLSYPKTTIYRLANTLLEMGYLGKDEDTNHFFLSRKLFRLGLAALGESNILERSIEPMRRLRDEVKESVMIGTLVGNEAILLDQVLGSHDFTFILKSGTHLCLHASAPGKVLLAYQTDKVRDELIASMEMTRFNENTITDKKRYLQEVLKVKERGYGVDLEEEIIGVNCIGAPIFNQYGEVIACVWMSGPKGRMPLERFPELAEQVCKCARSISEKMGYRINCLQFIEN